MQASFPPYYGGYEPSLANIAPPPIPSQPSMNLNMPFAFPLGQPIPYYPPFIFDSQIGQPGPSSSRPLHSPSHNPLPVIRHVQRVKRLTMEERFLQLKHDDYVLDFNAVEVKCSGCERVVKLDRRDGAKYYLGLWHKHKRSCRGVREKMTVRRRTTGAS